MNILKKHPFRIFKTYRTSLKRLDRGWLEQGYYRIPEISIGYYLKYHKFFHLKFPPGIFQTKNFVCKRFVRK